MADSIYTAARAHRRWCCKASCALRGAEQGNWVHSVHRCPGRPRPTKIESCRTACHTPGTPQKGGSGKRFTRPKTMRAPTWSVHATTVAVVSRAGTHLLLRHRSWSRSAFVRPSRGRPALFRCAANGPRFHGVQRASRLPVCREHCKDQQGKLDNPQRSAPSPRSGAKSHW